MLSDLTLNNIMRMVAGEKYNETAVRRLQLIAKEILEFGGMSDPGDFVKILGWLDFYGLETKAIKIRENMDEFLQGLIDEHRKDQLGKSVVENTMISHLLSLQESQPDYYTDQIIRMLIMDMIVAGTETTVVALEWAMCLLLNHPEKLEKARAELNANITGQDVLMDENHIPNLPYLQAIVSETFRLYPPGPLLLPHYSSGDCTVGGFNIPDGTMLFVNAWALQRDPAVWENPEEFIPERFEKREGETYKLMPFGIRTADKNAVE
uniref:Cytochrome P450 n=1 Tax=Kalanchoe fedtschenkoi TaxID=63787 RepID=A0A7N0TEF3_KALFE